MKMDKASVKTMHRQCSGIARQQNKGMPVPKLIWVWRMPMGEESVKTMHRQCSGIVGLQNKGLQKPKIIWV